MHFKFEIQVILIMVVALVAGNEVIKVSPNEHAYVPELSAKLSESSEELLGSASDLSPSLSANSHKIVATGWPYTSKMWPTIHKADDSKIENTTRWPQLMEPFIYADKPRSVDYSLLLALNQSIIASLKSHLKPVAVNISFEYYFNHEPKISAPPGIKIEVDRKQFAYIEPNGDVGPIKVRVWIRFNERIMITDLSQLDNRDWLKFSLVNRQSPSLIAIRRLKIEFHTNPSESSVQNLPKISESTNSNVSPSIDLTSSTIPSPVSSPLPVTTPAIVSPTSASSIPAPQSQPLPPSINEVPVQPPVVSPQSPPDAFPGDSIDSNPVPVKPAELPAPAIDQIAPASSNIALSTLKPPDGKPSGWNIWNKIGRRKRDTMSQAPTISKTPDEIVLTCFQSDRCDWQADSPGEQIQWSLARMPPSTDAVQLGYYYVSNKLNYGDSTSMLYLSLNQTDAATISDQNSDHCIEIALYVSQRTHMKMYQVRRDNTGPLSQWVKGNLLLSWAPTIADELDKGSMRSSLPNSRLAAMDDGRNGWTYETLCFGDFFSDSRDCGTGLCALGFEMIVDSHRHSSSEFINLEDTSASTGVPGSTREPMIDQNQELELVVGLALLREYTLNVPLRPVKSKWLETWQRDEVEPGDNWRFYPKLDYVINANNISFLNYFDGAHYIIESDWLNMDSNLELTAILSIDLLGLNHTGSLNYTVVSDEQPSSLDQLNIFKLKIITNLVDPTFKSIFNDSSTIDWYLRNNSTQYNLSLPISENIESAGHGQLQPEGEYNLFKIVFEFILDTHWLAPGSFIERLITGNDLSYRLSLANVSLSDRCYPNPCEFGICQQNGTSHEDWNCQCDDRHRGRKCQFGRWCNLPHVTPWVGPSWQDNNKFGPAPAITLKTPQPIRQPKLAIESVSRVSGKDYCQKKLGPGFKCTDIDLKLNDILYTEEDKTFICSCQDDYYLSDDSRCRQAHLCNSIVCPSIGMICDETKPFNRTQPCHCDDKQDWYPETQEVGNKKCVRRQCHDKQRDCQFDAHICLPTLPGEKPICKCGPKFTLKTNEKGHKYCQSTACVLPTLNDCDQICLPDSSNLERPYTCSCHPGYSLAPDGHTCNLQRTHPLPHCKPACDTNTQICTDAGCKCKQGFIGESEVRIQQAPKNRLITTVNGTDHQQNLTYYTQSIRCLNICKLTYAENKEEFELIESVCPLGLCDESNFECRCSDPSSSALINTKYEPIYANISLETDSDEPRQRSSPLCHLRRICEPDSSSYKICKSQGAICVPDYTKAAMFDCICPPSTDKKFYGQETTSEFSCEPKCAGKKNDCLRRQSVCRLVDRDAVKCECLPGLMFDKQDQRCYLAKYSYSFNIVVVNRYYEPESKFHKLETLNRTESIDGTDGSNHEFEHKEPIDLAEITLQNSHFRNGLNSRSIFITEYNQCNISQVIPKSVIEDPYEHNIESYLSYIEQCNEKIHQNVRTYHLNSKLGEDLRQSLRQHIRDFTVTTSNSSCTETDSSGMYINCTVYLQSNEPIPAAIVEYVLTDCDKHGQSEKFCWIKPRLLLKKSIEPHQRSISNETKFHLDGLNYRQIVPCEIDNFCGFDAYSVRSDDKTSLCSCKCPPDIDVIDVKDLEKRQRDDDLSRISVKEVCAPRNFCGANSTFCDAKVGSICNYDVRLGSRCNCVYPSYEGTDGRCVEVIFSQLDNTLIVIIVVLGAGLLVSLAINLAMVSKSKGILGQSKQYPLKEFPPGRAKSRSTGVPNSAFSDD